jgi:hypothetical protein
MVLAFSSLDLSIVFAASKTRDQKVPAMTFDLGAGSTTSSNKACTSRSWTPSRQREFFDGAPENSKCVGLDCWNVQNVSTFPNTFTIVSPLICVFWIQLTWTNAVLSRIALVSHFYAEIRLSGKNPENTAKILFCQKTHGARRRDEGGQRPGLTTRGCGPALVTPTCGEAASAVASTPPSAYIYPLTWKQRGFSVFPR